MKHTHLLILSLLLPFIACNRSGNTITPIDISQYYEGKANLTEAESQEINERILTDQQRATIGKTIPDIKVKDIDGKEYRRAHTTAEIPRGCRKGGRTDRQ